MNTRLREIRFLPTHCVCCIPAGAEYTATIQIQGPIPTSKNNLLLLHVAQLKAPSTILLLANGRLNRGHKHGEMTGDLKTN